MIAHKTPTSILTPSIMPFPSVTGTVPAWGVRTRTRDCFAHLTFPDKLCTPGDIFPNVAAAIVCVPGYTKTVRAVTTRDKVNIEREYNIVYNSKVDQEIDHLVPLELGGNNDYSNLWPEFAVPLPGYHQKDVVENYLHRQVCAGKMSLLQAQVYIATNWVSVWLMLPPAYREP